MKIRNITVVIAVLIGALALTLPLHADNKIKIGISTALTGNGATYGNDLKNVVIFANEKLANNRYDLVFDDDKCDGREAVAVAHRFIDVLNLKYVTGFACSSTVLSTAKLYNNAGAIVLTMSASAADISKVGVFRTWSSDEGAARKLFEYVATKQKKLGILSEQTDYAEGFLKSFTDSNRDNKIEIFSESFLTDNPDFRSVLLKLRGKNIDSLFINSQSESTFLAALKQVKEMGINVQLYSAYWAGSAAFLDKANGMSEGIIYVDLPSLNEAATADGLKVYEEFVKKFGKMNSIELMFMSAYEGFRALHQAIESGKDMRQYLHSTTFHGLFGDWSFDEHGDIQGLNFVLKVIREGKPERI